MGLLSVDGHMHNFLQHSGHTLGKSSAKTLWGHGQGPERVTRADVSIGTHHLKSREKYLRKRNLCDQTKKSQAQGQAGPGGEALGSCGF